MLSVIKANYINDYSIELTFSNGKSGIVDLKEIIFKDTRPIFKPLKELDYFRSFKVELDTLAWENNLDFAPEFLFFKAFQNNKEYINDFKKWGYIS